MKIRSRYNLGDVPLGTVNEEPSMTSQEFKQDTDIYYILNRFSDVYGEAMNPANFVYADYDKDEDYEYWQNKINETRTQFYNLSAEQRARFHHNVAHFHKFIQNSENFRQGVEWGIFEPNRDEYGNVLPYQYQEYPGQKYEPPKAETSTETVEK